MLTELCQYLRNWFELSKLHGSFKVEGGVLTYADGTALPVLQNQYYRVIGSVFSDGVHKYGVETLVNEPEFLGSVWTMGVPTELVTLAGEIAAWRETNADALNSPYQSESFGGYSYSLKSGGADAGQSGGPTWQSQFAARLAPWRKI